MNFHKTIGFLASLLLVLGIGVPDSFAQPVVKNVTLSVSPSTIRDSSSVAVTVTARIGVELSAATTVATGQDVTIGVTGTADDSYTLSENTGITVNVPQNATTGSIRHQLVFTMAADNDADDESITLTATAAAQGANSGDITDTAMLTITDHSVTMTANAVSARGFRVEIAAPADGAVASGGKDKIKVRVLRKGGLAAEFGAFTNIAVALRSRSATPDNLTDDTDLYTLDITDDTQLSTLVLSRVKTAELTGDATAPGGTDVNKYWQHQSVLYAEVLVNRL